MGFGIKIIVLAAFAYLLTSCESVPVKELKCDVAKSVGDSISQGIATELKCDKEKVKKSVDEALVKIGACSDDQRKNALLIHSNVSEFLCASAIDILESTVIERVIPASWACAVNDLPALKKVKDQVCYKIKPSPSPSVSPSTTPSAKPSLSPVVGLNCEEVKEKIKLRHGEIELPDSGKMVEESHYATKDETFGLEKRLFPKEGREQIERHLKKSCELLYQMYKIGDGLSCGDIYKNSWERAWTPSENGKVGQGARGDFKPDTVSEMWQGNMMFASGQLPKIGTKYIVTNPANGKKVVINMGYEIGPGDKNFLGGVTTEVHYVLKAQNSTILKLGKAADQSLPYGPLDKCK
jgi:hypothetical protein